MQASWQWDVAVDSLFFWAVGIFPSKDTFYSSAVEVQKQAPNAPGDCPFHNFVVRLAVFLCN